MMLKLCFIIELYRTFHATGCFLSQPSSKQLSVVRPRGPRGKGASYEQTCLSCTKKCYITNIKVQCLPVSERENFEVGLLCSYLPSCDSRGGASFNPRGIK